jgi:hypothetical protein
MFSRKRCNYLYSVHNSVHYIPQASSPEFRQGWAAFLLRWGPLSNSRVGSCTTQVRTTFQLKGGQLHYSSEDHFPTQGWAAGLLKCRQLPNSSVGSFLTQVWTPYIAAVLFVSAQLFYLWWCDAVLLRRGPFKWAAVNRFGICLKHNKRFNIERRGVGKLGGGQVDIIMAAEGWWGQYLACGEGSSYLPPPLLSALTTGVQLIVQ